jgi:hypothetical protein
MVPHENDAIAAQTVASVLEEIKNFVKDGMSDAAKSKLLGVTLPKYGRSYVTVPAVASTNYAKVLTASAAWSGGKGPMLASREMYHPSSNRKLFIKQYDKECSIVVMDPSVASPRLNADNKTFRPKVSIWTEFLISKLVIEDTVLELKAKGWVLLIPALKRQSTFVET